MRNWALTTAVIDGSPYHRDIFPLTCPLMLAYAHKWDMAFCPLLLSTDQLAGLGSASPAPPGTEADFASIPHRRRLLDEYDGVVFLDSDVVIVDSAEDICTTVDDHQPIGTINGWGCVVMKSGELSKAYLDTIWAMRDAYRSHQWLEQAAGIHLIGYSPAYPGDNEPPIWMGPTAWTPYHRTLDVKWNWGPYSRDDCANPLFIHPFGVQPYPARLALVRRYEEIARTLG